MKKKIMAIFFALLAAALYALNMPFSKLLLNDVSPTMLASFLYLGAGFGIGLFYLLNNKNKDEYEKIESRDIIYVLGMIVLDIIAPILLMFGLNLSESSSATLLNNFEIVATSIIALLIFKESISFRMWIAIVLVTFSSFFLSIDDIASFSFSKGSLLVLLATCCWGLENNCTRKLSSKNTYQIVFLKGIFSGLGSLIIALCINETLPAFNLILLAMLLGFVAYGLSIFFYIKAQKDLGASKTSAYYSIAPFIGTFLSFLILKEKINTYYFIGLIIMIIGTIVIIIDTLTVKHSHEHTHVIKVIEDGKEVNKTITHTHEHSHIINLNNHPYIARTHKKENIHD